MGLLPLLAALTVRQGGGPPPAAEIEAQALLEKAQDLAAKGQYAAAVAAYRRLAESHGDTSAGAVGARRSQPNGFLGWTDLARGGPSSNRVDVVVMGDGYTLPRLGPFDDIAKTVPTVLGRNEVFEEYFTYFNLLRANVVSREDGVDGFGRTYDTALGGRMSGGLQGQVTVDHSLVFRVLDEMPEHDRLAIVFVKAGTLGTGGGGIAIVGGRNDETLVHEFGHAFAGLMDEYDTDTGHRAGVPNRGNVSDSADPARVPWKHWLDARVPGIGIYEGANGQVRGAWRPVASGCVMQSAAQYCRVCREAIVLSIYERVDPIEGCAPDPHPSAGSASLPVSRRRHGEGKERLRFEVTVTQPRTHELDATWWVLRENRASREASASVGQPRSGGRGARGPLPRIEEKPARGGTNPRPGLHRFDFDPTDLAPGRYRVVCRARDATRLPGERWPWVLKDERGVLESERGWWVAVGE